VINCYLTPSDAMCQLYHSENQLLFSEMMIDACFLLEQHT